MKETLALLVLSFLIAGCGNRQTATPSEPTIGNSGYELPVAPPEFKERSKPTLLYGQSDLVSARKKVKTLLGRGNAMYLLHGELTNDPALCLIVLKRDWNSFSGKERAALRPIIKEQITVLWAHPEKYAATKEGAPLWDFMIGKIQNTAPAVMLSDRKVGRGNFEFSDRIDDFDAMPGKGEPAPPKVIEKGSGSLDEQLMSAIARDDVVAVRKLLTRGASPNASWSSNGMSALTSAAVSGNLQIVKLLVEKGADVNQMDSNFGWTALQFAHNELKNERDNPRKYEAVIAYLESR